MKRRKLYISNYYILGLIYLIHTGLCEIIYNMQKQQAINHPLLYTQPFFTNDRKHIVE